MLLIINKMYPPEVGGIEVITEQLAETGKEVYGSSAVLTFNGCRENQAERKEGIRIYRLGTAFSYSSIRFSFLYRRYYKKLAEESHITIFNYPSFQPELHSSNKKNTNIVYYHADNTKFGVIGRLYQRFITPKFLKEMDYIVTASPNIIDSSSTLRKYKEKCMVIPYGIDLKHFTYKQSNKRLEILSEFEDIKPLEKDRKLILFVGRMSRYKGIRYLLRALALLPEEYCLLLISKDQISEANKNIITRDQLTDRILHINDISYQNLPQYYSAADLSVLPSVDKAEAFGLVVVEAMACGIPVITTELGTGTTFHNIHGKTGIIIPPSDENKLADAILFILNNKDKFKPEVIRKRAEDFGIEEFKAKWKTLFTKLDATN